MSHVIITGGGAAGMAAALAASEQGCQVDLYEKNEKLGKKIYITGKGRCNLTNACAPEDFFSHICTNPKFMYSSFYDCTNEDVIRFFETHGMHTKTERGERVFPVSDHASDVIRALSDEMRRRGVRIHLMEEVREICTTEEDGKKRACGIRTAGSREIIPADAVIVATGGLSYPSTGSTGDGYRFARDTGHRVTSLSPSLVPMNTEGDDALMMQGLSLRNISIRIRDQKKILYQEFGELMFTHFGVTGPLILTASTKVQKELSSRPLQLEIDLKPALDEAALDARFVREFEAAPNKALKNIFGKIYPSKMIPVILKRTGLPPDKAARDVTRPERRRLLEVTKCLTFTLTGLRGFAEAVITRGGVNVKDIDPGTMESKVVRGLYFAGEVLDVDAVTGGFNLQIAWSTGTAAGRAVR
ncbi:MAG: NAD(P)/FAD-dependent oxidoreductase [Lachnospiraceae bacterium]|nr:NAD(P)/FAD-dependent oxidoreductase [Lachnospiraceae bacterium]